jgi:hypothetical protein
MAAQQDNTKKYKSKYTEKMVTAAAFLCDEIMERIAAKEKEKLPFRYWKTERWKQDFLRQIGEANKLLKVADVLSIMTFLRSPRGKLVYSLGLKKIILEGASKYMAIRDFVDKVEEVPDDVFLYEELEEVPKDPIESVSLWEKLRG